jgi:predicted  nucleic acid-binding Zn-ribbon protein
MNAVMIDTHKSVKALTNANLTEVQAEVIVNLMTDALGNNISNLATKEDIGNTRKDIVAIKDDIVAIKDDIVAIKDDIVAIKHDIVALKDEMQQEIVALKDDVNVIKHDIIAIKTEMVHLEDRIDHKLTKLELTLTIRMAVMLVGILGAFKAVEKFF